MNKVRAWTLVVATGLLLLGLTPVMGAERVIEHKQGQLRLQEVPQRVVTFDLASLDTLDALGVEIIGLPQEIIPTTLAHYRDGRYVSVGSLFEPDFETLAALRPDLIIIGGRSAPAYRQLSRIAPTVDLSHDYANFMEDFRELTLTLGEIFDKEAEVEAHLADIQNLLEETRQLSQEAGRGLVVLVSGGRLAAYGLGSRISWIHEELGLAPADENLKQGVHGDPVSFEFLLKTNPDYLFVLDRDTAIQSGKGSAQALLDNELIRQTQAWQKEQIIYLDSETWYTLVSGLNALPAMIGEVRAALVKE